MDTFIAKERRKRLCVIWKKPITARDIIRLRTLSGEGLLSCRKALEQAKGSKDKAMLILREYGQAECGRIKEGVL